MKTILKFTMTLSVIIFFEWITNAQSTATLKIGTLNVACYETGDDVHIPITLQNISWGSLIIYFQFSFHFDEDYLTWKGTPENPEPGLANINPAFLPLGNEWFFLSQPGSLVCGWWTTIGNAELNNGDIFFEIVFSYSMMPFPVLSPIDWSTVKIYTEMVDENYDNFDLTLINGSILTTQCCTELNLKAYLEGPYNNGLMTTNLNLSGYLPTQQPFNSPPWNYFGTESVPAITNMNIVDWVLIELRESSGDVTTAGAVTCFDKQAGFILKNGNIIGTNGLPLWFWNGTNQNLYVVLHHRNHLSIISSNPLVETYGYIYSYDFSESATKAYGGSQAQKELTPEVWGLISGNGNGNIYINYSDKLDIWNPQSGLSGYKSGDFNLDGNVNNSDKNNNWVPNIGKISFVPN